MKQQTLLSRLLLPVLVVLLLKPRQRRYWQNQSNKNSNYNAYLAESIDGVRVSQLFARQGRHLDLDMGQFFQFHASITPSCIRAVRAAAYFCFYYT